MGLYKKKKKLLIVRTTLELGIMIFLGHVRITLAKKLRELSGVEEGVLYRLDLIRIYKLRDEIQKLKSKEETMWKQRSYVEWLKKGVHNIRYFHFRANQRNKHNYILGFEDETGHWVEDDD